MEPTVQEIVGGLLNTPSVEKNMLHSDEDCLTLNVQRPAVGDDSSSDPLLPVLFWIFGGSFEQGSTRSYDAESMLVEAIDYGSPFVFVAANYRLGGFGFLAGKEVKEEGVSNLGLLDQRLALQWVADHIADFGGDPDHVTLWGESAGSISVFNQLLLYDGDHTYNGRPLFGGAIMDSGSLMPVNSVDSPKAQQIYDAVVQAAGCTGGVATDSLDCLRNVDYETFHNAANSVPSLLSLNVVERSYDPRPAPGSALPSPPDEMVKQGRFAKVPFIIGDQEDEGTLFSIFIANLSTPTDVIDFYSSRLPDAPRSLVEQLVSSYDDFSSHGSPFRTDNSPLNNIYPQYKRIAAIFGDLYFNLARREFLEYAAHVYGDDGLPGWSFLSTYYHGLPVLGTTHFSDIIKVFDGDAKRPFATSAMRQYIFSFLYHRDPNHHGSGESLYWPRWSLEGRAMLNISSHDALIMRDDYREDSYEIIRDHVAELRI